MPRTNKVVEEINKVLDLNSESIVEEDVRTIKKVEDLPEYVEILVDTEHSGLQRKKIFRNDEYEYVGWYRSVHPTSNSPDENYRLVYFDGYRFYEDRSKRKRAFDLGWITFRKEDQ